MVCPLTAWSTAVSDVDFDGSQMTGTFVDTFVVVTFLAVSHKRVYDDR